MLNNADLKMQQIRGKMAQSLDPGNYEADSISPRNRGYGIIKTGESMKEYNRLIVQQMYADEFDKGTIRTS